MAGGVDLDRRLLEPLARGGLLFGGDRLVAPQASGFGHRHRARFDQRVGAIHGGVGFFGPGGGGGQIVAQRRNARIELANASLGELLRLLGQIVQARLRQFETPLERGPFVLDVGEPTAQIVETDAVGLVVGDAQRGRALRRRPARKIAGRGGDHAVDRRADGNDPRIDHRLDAGGHQQGLQRHPAEHHDEADADRRLDQLAGRDARQQPGAGGGGRVIGRFRGGLERRARRRFVLEGVDEGGAQAAGVERRRAIGFLRRIRDAGLRPDPVGRRIDPRARLGGANENSGFA